jgi:hypothetical protein
MALNGTFEMRPVKAVKGVKGAGVSKFKVQSQKSKVKSPERVRGSGVEDDLTHPPSAFALAYEGGWGAELDGLLWTALGCCRLLFHRLLVVLCGEGFSGVVVRWQAEDFVHFSD